MYYSANNLSYIRNKKLADDATANMIRGTAVKPEERKRKIMEGLRYTIIYITIIQNS